jgi:hypothetical protein
MDELVALLLADVTESAMDEVKTQWCGAHHKCGQCGGISSGNEGNGEVVEIATSVAEEA